MMNIYEFFRIVAEVETDRERNDISGNHISVNHILKINLWLILKMFKVWRWEIRKGMFADDSVPKPVTECNQCTVQHLDVEASRFLQFTINVPISHIL